MIKGVALAILSALLFGASTPLSKGLLGELSPQFLAGLLYFSSGLGLSLWNLTRRVGSTVPRTERHWLALAILCGGILGPVLLLTGLRSVAGSTASLLLSLEGVFTALLAWFAFHENFDRRIMAGMLCIVVGGVALSWSGAGLQLGGGAVFIVAACFCWALDNNFTQKVSGGDPLRITAIKGLSAGSFNLLLAYLLGQAILPTPALLAGAALVGILGYGVSLAAFVAALRYIGTARTGAYFSLAPFVGASLSLLIYHEPLTRRLGLAALCMGVGVYLHLTENHEHQHTHEAVEHEHEHEYDEHHQHSHLTGQEGGGAHTHAHRHERLIHKHPHYPDLHHRHEHPGDVD